MQKLTPQQAARLESLQEEREALVFDLNEATNSSYAKTSKEEAEQALAYFDEHNSAELNTLQRAAN